MFTMCSVSAISCDCQREHTEWDKLFIMLENSQMKENMLLESLDEILKVELQTLRAEMLQFVENFAGTCTTYLEKTTTQIWSQMDQMITKNRVSGGRSGMLHEIKQEKILQEILQLNQNLSNRLSHLEHAWQWRTEEGDQRSHSSEEGRVGYIMHGSNFMVKSLWQELQETKAELKESQKKTTKPSLPAGESDSFSSVTIALHIHSQPTTSTISLFSHLTWCFAYREGGIITVV